MSEDDPAPAIPAVPVRPVAVLDANVLVPAGLRDLMLSCADVGVFRPVWQAELEDEVVRNIAGLTAERHDIELDQAHASAAATMAQMRRAFPEACAATELWTPLVGQMTCDDKDRHVLAVAVGTDATHLVTSNIRDFPVRSRPATRFNYERDIIRLVLPAFKGFTLREIGVARCDALLKQLGNSSYSSAKRARTVLRQSFALAVRHEVLPRNPIDNLSRLHKPKRTLTALTATEVNAIRE